MTGNSRGARSASAAWEALAVTGLDFLALVVLCLISATYRVLFEGYHYPLFTQAWSTILFILVVYSITFCAQFIFILIANFIFVVAGGSVRSRLLLVLNLIFVALDAILVFSETSSLDPFLLFGLPALCAAGMVLAGWIQRRRSRPQTA